MAERQISGVSLEFFGAACKSLSRIYPRRSCEGLEEVRKHLEAAERAFAAMTPMLKKTKH